jgi:spore coat protein U-like protein
MQVKSMCKFNLSLLLALFSLFLVGEARAACNFTSVTGVNFGSYDTLSSNNDDSTGSITVFCDARTWVTTTIGASPNSGSFNPRQMKLTTGADLLNYNLYRDTSRTQIWGDGTQGTSYDFRRIPRNTARTLTIYGRIPSGMSVSVGNYSETLVVTISY